MGDLRPVSDLPTEVYCKGGFCPPGKGPGVGPACLPALTVGKSASEVSEVL